MPRRRVLTSAQISELLALPTDEPTLIRHYTLSDADLAVIQRRRRPYNRLGFALQLSTLRYPGRLPRPGEFIPAEILNFLAVQLDLDADNLASYGARSATRYEQLEALRREFGYSTFASLSASAFASEGSPTCRLLPDPARAERP
jgi:TnpA family transposase